MHNSFCCQRFFFFLLLPPAPPPPPLLQLRCTQIWQSFSNAKLIMNSCIKYCTSEAHQAQSAIGMARALEETLLASFYSCATVQRARLCVCVCAAWAVCCMRIWRVRTLRSVMSFQRAHECYCDDMFAYFYFAFCSHRIGDSHGPNGTTDRNTAWHSTQIENYFYFYSSHDLKRKIIGHRWGQ